MNENDGRYSYTSYKRLENTNLFSYVELYPTTGRTHQLRVHLQYLGFPIIMDDLYGGGLKYKTNFSTPQPLGLRGLWFLRGKMTFI